MQNPAMEPLDGRELRSVRTRQRIRQAAVDLFEQRGVDSVTVDEIADVAGISRRTSSTTSRQRRMRRCCPWTGGPACSRKVWKRRANSGPSPMRSSS
jgi:hypothetical protein